MMKGDSQVLVTTAEELRAQGITYDSAIEFTFQGKPFKRVLSLRKLFHEIVTNFCQRETEKGKFCLLIEDETHFTIWQTEEPSELTNREADLKAETSSVQADLNQLIPAHRTAFIERENPLSSTNGSSGIGQIRSDRNDNDRASAFSHTVPVSIEPKFLFHCQQVLFDYVGPIAGSYILETLTQFPTITHRQLINQLATKIPNPQQAEEFWQRVLTMKTAPVRAIDPQPKHDATPEQSTSEQPPSRPKPASEADQYRRSYRGVSY
ncbi:MAG: hypothetical protein HC866_15260 [Leptolyngbyaceae cyanobacterium RU_5_1]|nr:hypothetical protein [Leptolyngbyaceae cyanobacterium RU_5_1]